MKNPKGNTIALLSLLSHKKFNLETRSHKGHQTQPLVNGNFKMYLQLHIAFLIEL